MGNPCTKCSAHVLYHWVYLLTKTEPRVVMSWDHLQHYATFHSLCHLLLLNSPNNALFLN